MADTRSTRSHIYGKSICLLTGKEVASENFSFIIDPSGERFSLDDFPISGSESIAIIFPNFTDGRGFSIAARLRENHPNLRLHAVGKINEELSYFLKRSGFDTMFISSLDSTMTEEIKMQRIINPFKHHYQSGNDGSKGVF